MGDTWQRLEAWLGTEGHGVFMDSDADPNPPGALYACELDTDGEDSIIAHMPTLEAAVGLALDMADRGGG